MPPSRLRQLLKFIRVFGLGAALRLWWVLLRGADAQTGLLRLPVPGLSSPLTLRERDLPIFWQIWVMRENDFSKLAQAAQVSSTYNAMLRGGHTPVVVDCGGHVGLSAVWFAAQFPKATIYTIEPSDANFALLETNTKAYRNIIPLKGGVWSQACHLEIANPGSGSASFQLREVFDAEAARRSDLLRAYTIDEVAAMGPQNRLLLVKIDVEGAEAELFRDPGPWLGEVPALVIELHDWLLPGQGTSRNFFRRIGAYPFDVILQGENLLVFSVAGRNEEASSPSEPLAPAAAMVS